MTVKHDKDMEWRARLFDAVHRRLRENAARHCLGDNETCGNPTIRAHSVQCGYALEQLTNDGHVYMFKIDAKRGYILNRLGKRRATVFTGYCAVHDNKLFREVDFDEAHPFDPDSKRQRILLSLRAASREYWAKLNVKALNEQMGALIRAKDTDGIRLMLNVGKIEAQRLVQEGVNVILPYHEGTKVSLKRLRRLHQSLYTQIEQDRYHLTKTHEYIIKNTVSCAASSCYAPEYDLDGNPINTLQLHTDVSDVVLTILPYEGDTWVMFTYHKRHKHQLSSLFAMIDELEDDELRVTLSQMVIMHCENVAFSPEFAESLTDTEREQLCNLFGATILRAMPYSESPSVNLF
jgi:hypothetical protein